LGIGLETRKNPFYENNLFKQMSCQRNAWLTFVELLHPMVTSTKPHAVAVTSLSH